MDIKLLVVFIMLNAFNVIIQTVKSIITIKGGKLLAAAVNACAYGLYTVVVVYMMCELPLGWKALIIAACNFIGVYAVKYFEEKARKDKLWKIEMTVNSSHAAKVHAELVVKGIPHNYIPNIGKWTLFNCYCATQSESREVHECGKAFGAKFFASEAKCL